MFWEGHNIWKNIPENLNFMKKIQYKYQFEEKSKLQLYNIFKSNLDIFFKFCGLHRLSFTSIKIINKVIHLFEIDRNFRMGIKTLLIILIEDMKNKVTVHIWSLFNFRLDTQPVISILNRIYCCWWQLLHIAFSFWWHVKTLSL